MNAHKKLIITLFSTVFLLSSKHTYSMTPESPDLHESAAKGAPASDGNPYEVTPGKSIYLHQLARVAHGTRYVTMAQSFGIISAENAEPITPFDSHTANLTIHEEGNSGTSQELASEEETKQTFALAPYTIDGHLPMNACLEEQVINNLRDLLIALKNPAPSLPEFTLLHQLATKESRRNIDILGLNDSNIYSRQWADRATHTPQNAGQRLFAAALGSVYSGIELALQDGANLNTIVDQEGGDTILHHIVYGKDVETAQFLIERNADVNKPNDRGETPLHKAVKGKNKTSMTELLLRAKANPDIQDNVGFSARNIASGRDICTNTNTLISLIDRITKEDNNNAATDEDKSESDDQYD